jgi:cytochrome c5
VIPFFRVLESAFMGSSFLGSRMKMYETTHLCTLLVAVSMAPAIAGSSEGKEVFDKSCKACHGATGQGNPEMAKMLKVEMRALG